MCIKLENPKMKHFEIRNQLKCPSSTIQGYRNDLILISSYRIQPNTTKKRTNKPLKTIFDNNSYREHDPKRLQLTSIDL